MLTFTVIIPITITLSAPDTLSFNYIVAYFLIIQFFAVFERSLLNIIQEFYGSFNSKLLVHKLYINLYFTTDVIRLNGNASGRIRPDVHHEHRQDLYVCTNVK